MLAECGRKGLERVSFSFSYVLRRFGASLSKFTGLTVPEEPFRARSRTVKIVCGPCLRRNLWLFATCPQFSWLGNLLTFVELFVSVWFMGGLVGAILRAKELAETCGGVCFTEAWKPKGWTTSFSFFLCICWIKEGETGLFFCGKQGEFRGCPLVRLGRRTEGEEEGSGGIGGAC